MHAFVLGGSLAALEARIAQFDEPHNGALWDSDITNALDGAVFRLYGDMRQDDLAITRILNEPANRPANRRTGSFGIEFSPRGRPDVGIQPFNVDETHHGFGFLALFAGAPLPFACRSTSPASLRRALSRSESWRFVAARDLSLDDGCAGFCTLDILASDKCRRLHVVCGQQFTARLPIRATSLGFRFLTALVGLGFSSRQFGLRNLDDFPSEPGHAFERGLAVARFFLGLVHGFLLPRCWRGLPESCSGGLSAFGCGEGAIREATANDLAERQDEAASVRELPVIEAPRLFVEISEQMEGLDVHVRTLDRPLEQAPEVFEPVRVDPALRIRLGVVDDLVNVLLFTESGVGLESIRVDRRAGLDMLPDFRGQHGAADVANDARADAARRTTLQKSHHGRHAHPTPPLLAGDEPVLVPRQPMAPIAGLAADVGLVGFDFAAHFREGLRLHGETDSVQHEPRRLLRDTQGPRGLVGADAVLAVHGHPEARKPLVQADRRILEDGPELNRELLLASGALPDATRREEGMLLTLAARAVDTFRPAQANQERKANIGVREVADRFDQRGGNSRGLFHARESTSRGRVSQVYCCERLDDPTSPRRASGAASRSDPGARCRGRAPRDSCCRR